MAHFSLKHVFFVTLLVALAIAAVQNANLAWLLAIVVGTMLVLRRLAQVQHFTLPAVGGFAIMGLFCLRLIALVFKSPPAHPGLSHSAILFSIGMVLFVCLFGTVMKSLSSLLAYGSRVQERNVVAGSLIRGTGVVVAVLLGLWAMMIVLAVVAGLTVD